MRKVLVSVYVDAMIVQVMSISVATLLHAGFEQLAYCVQPLPNMVLT